MEQQITDSDESGRPTDALLAKAVKKGSRGAQLSSDKLCINCKCTSHVANTCWQKGGAIEGKCDEVLAKNQKCCNQRDKKKQGSATLKHMTDNSGCVYLVNDATGEAIYMLPTPPTAPTPAGTVNVSSPEFAGLASDPMPASFTSLAPGDHFEFDSFLAFEEVIKVSMDWCDHCCDIDLAAITVSPDNVTACVPISVSPFFLDTGATTHINHDCSNFLTLHPIQTRLVQGVSGSIISTAGIGPTKLTAGKGVHTILKDVLSYLAQQFT